jgi:hypothetical protein
MKTGKVYLQVLYDCVFDVVCVVQTLLFGQVDAIYIYISQNQYIVPIVMLANVF